MLQGRLKGVSREFSMVFVRNSKGISGCFRGDFRVLQQSVKGVSRKFQGFFKEE